MWRERREGKWVGRWEIRVKVGMELWERLRVRRVGKRRGGEGGEEEEEVVVWG